MSWASVADIVTTTIFPYVAVHIVLYQERKRLAEFIVKKGLRREFTQWVDDGEGK